MHLDGLRPLREPRRQRVPVELPAARHLLVGRRHHHAAHRQEGRRLRQAQGQEDRAGLSRLALRQGADRAARAARQDARLRVHADAGHPSRRRAEGDVAADPPEPAGLRPAVGLGRHELDRRSRKRPPSASRATRCIGVWWSGAEPDVRPAEGGAKGYNAAMLQHGAGQFGVHADLKKYLYDKGKGAREVRRDRRGALQPRPDQRACWASSRSARRRPSSATSR